MKFPKLFSNKSVDVQMDAVKTPSNKDAQIDTVKTPSKVVYNYVNGTGYNRTQIYKPKVYADYSAGLDPETRVDVVSTARRLYTNNGELKAIVDQIANLATNGAFIPKSEGTDKAWFELKARPFWWIWENNCDLQNKLNFNEMLRVASTCIDVDGEVLFILSENPETKWPLINLVRSHRCKTNPEDKTGRIIKDGIVFDENGKPLAYQFTNGEEGKKQTFVEIAANSVIHLYRSEAPDQVRGTSGLVHAIDLMERILNLRQSELIALQLTSNMGIIKKTATGAPQVMNFDEETNTTTCSVYKPMRLEDSAAGGVHYINPDEDFKELAVNRPSDQFQNYLDNLLNTVCLGLRFPYGILKIGKMSGAEVRLQMGLLDRTVKERQELLAKAANQIFRYVMAKRIKINKLPEPSDGDFFSIRWSSGKKLTVDVGRDSTAEINSLKAGTTTYTEIYENLGLDANEMLEQKAKEAASINQLAEKYGVSPQEISQLAPNESRPIDNGDNNKNE